MGTVASNITQTVSFYNTTGVIEKEHNLYFTPRDASTPYLYLQSLISVVSRKTEYENIEISQWSPEDRVLSVKGIIDDFRSSITDYPLNYAIVTRMVTDEYSQVKTYYYAFFITGARQHGNNAVTLELEPDHFTNVFFLQRTQTLPAGTDVFNYYLKNAYVERQHYDRVESGANKKARGYLNFRTDMGGSFSGNRRIKKVEGYIYPLTGVVESIVIQDTTQHINFGISDFVITDTGTGYLEFYIEGQADAYEENITVIVMYDYSTSFVLSNLSLFSNYEESFVYRRQIRNYHEMLNYGNVDETEKEKLTSINGTWSDLSDTEKLAILNYCLAFATCTFKNDECLLPYVEELKSTGKNPYKKMPKVYPMAKDNLVTITIPVAVIPKFLSNYEYEINRAFGIFKLKNQNKTVYNNFSEILNTNIFSEYIVSLSITKEHILREHLVFEKFTLLNITDFFPVIDESVESGSTPQLTMFYAGKDETVTQGGFTGNVLEMIKDRYLGFSLDRYLVFDYYVPVFRLSKKFADNSGLLDADLIAIQSALNSVLSNQLGIFGFICSDIEADYQLTLDYRIKDTKSYYYEPLLEFNPYSFYSISYLGRIECPLNLRNYIENFDAGTNKFNINFKQIVAISDTTKYTFIPSYIIEGKETLYYSESLEVTTPNQLTILSDVMLQYIAQNTAQMKNQYAVNDKDLGKGMITSAVSGLVTGVGLGMYGGPVVGVVAGIVGAGAGAIGTAIKWAYNKEEIAMNQKAKLADLGNLPDNVKQVGTDMATDLSIGEIGLYLNHYTIDEISYNNICKYLERYGYVVNLYATINAFNRKGWNYVKLIDMEFDKQLSAEQEESIRQIFTAGVTLLHEPSYLHNDSVHNYETILD